MRSLMSALSRSLAQPVEIRAAVRKQAFALTPQSNSSASATVEASADEHLPLVLLVRGAGAPGCAVAIASRQTMAVIGLTPGGLVLRGA